MAESTESQSPLNLEEDHVENVNGVTDDSHQPSQPIDVMEGDDNKTVENETIPTNVKDEVPEKFVLVKLKNGDVHSTVDPDPVTAASNDSTFGVCRSESSSPFSDLSEVESVDEKPRIRYSRDQLMRLMDAPASRRWPHYFSVTFMKPQKKMIDLERWMKVKQDQQPNPANASGGSFAPLSNGSGVRIPLERPPEVEIKRSKDPRERVKHDEQDGIVLSPQRRSFGTGCHVSQQGSLSLGGGGGGGGSGGGGSAGPDSRESHREIPVRRIGSGRIMRREDPDQISLSDRRRERENDREMEPRRDHKEWRSKNDSRFDRDDRHLDRRRRFYEEDDKRGERRGEMRDNRRFPDHRDNNRRSSSSRDYEEEPPEWFTGGPSSQNEFIELVGFDEAPQQEERTASKPKRERRRSKKEKDGGSGKNSRCTTPAITEHENEEMKMKQEEPPKIEKPIVVEPTNNDQDAMQFNLDDYLGSILNFDEVFQGSSGASRLKQFFKNRESPVEEVEANTEANKTSSGKFPQLGNLLGFAEPVIRIPSPNSGLDSNRFFAPISPADKTNGDAIVEMLQHHADPKRAQQHPVAGSGRLPPPSVKDLLRGGKGQILEEIEANMRKGQQIPTSAGVSNRLNQPFIATKAPHNQQHMQQQQLHQQSQHQQNQMRPSTMTSQHNLFNDFFSQVSEMPRKLVVENGRENDNILAQLLKDAPGNQSSVGNKPAMPNNAPTESELIARFMKNNASITGGGVPPVLSMKVNPIRNQPSLPAGLNVPSHNLPPNQSSIPQHSPSRSHLVPPPPQQQLPQSSTNSDILMMKLMQNQQQQMQQHKKHMIHPAYQQPQPPQPQHHDPIKQLLGGLNNLGLNSNQQNQDQLARDALMRPDVQSLLQRVISRQITDAQLVAQLNAGNITPSQREAVATVLKLINCHPSSTTLMPPRTTLTPSPTPQSMMGGALTLGTTPSSLSPRVASPNPDGSNMLAPHMVQQTRVSPLMFGGNSGPRRTPSHHELVVHTQSILQNALLKQELEKAKAKHRKRDSERTRSPNPAAPSMPNGPSMGMSHNTSCANRGNQNASPTAKCQSPLVFTPTSVMRKMTAEKDRLDKDSKIEMLNINSNEAEKMVREQHVNRMSTAMSNHASHQGMNLKVDKQLRKVPSPLPSGNSVLGPRAQMVLSGGQSTPMMTMGPPPHALPTSQRHMTMQPNMPIGRPNQHNVNNIRVMQHQAHQVSHAQQMMRNQLSHMGNMGHHHTPQSRVSNSHQDDLLLYLALGHDKKNNYKQGETSLTVPRPMGSSTSQSNSPVNNLMNLFGREVMSKVQAGAMPELPGGKVLSVEELERIHQTQAVPN